MYEIKGLSDYCERKSISKSMFEISVWQHLGAIEKMTDIRVTLKGTICIGGCE